jgi:hypothetical protein
MEAPHTSVFGVECIASRLLHPSHAKRGRVARVARRVGAFINLYEDFGSASSRATQPSSPARAAG